MLFLKERSPGCAIPANLDLLLPGAFAGGVAGWCLLNELPLLIVYFLFFCFLPSSPSADCSQEAETGALEGESEQYVQGEGRPASRGLEGAQSCWSWRWE